MVTALHIDSARCKDTGVCRAIAPDHLGVFDGAIRPIPNTSVSLWNAKLAAECCPTEAITVIDEQ